MTRIHTETIGAGKPIVLIHGWAMHSGIWRRFAQNLAKNYKVTLLDLPGHGLSPPVSPFNLQTVTDVLAEAVPEEACCWLGWSLGAEIAIEIARRFPGKANGLILLAGTPCFIKKDTWPGVDAQTLAKFGENLRRNSRAALLEFLSLQVRGIEHPDIVLQELQPAIFNSPAPTPETLQEGLIVLEKTDLRPAFARLTIPVEVILGELDTLVPARIGDKLIELLPRADIAFIGRAGHVPFLSHEEAVLTVIRQFMDKH